MRDAINSCSSADLSLARSTALAKDVVILELVYDELTS